MPNVKNTEVLKKEYEKILNAICRVDLTNSMLLRNVGDKIDNTVNEKGDFDPYAVMIIALSAELHIIRLLSVVYSSTNKNTIHAKCEAGHVYKKYINEKQNFIGILDVAQLNDLIDNYGINELTFPTVLLNYALYVFEHIDDPFMHIVSIFRRIVVSKNLTGYHEAYYNDYDSYLGDIHAADNSTELNEHGEKMIKRPPSVDYKIEETILCNKNVQHYITASLEKILGEVSDMLIVAATINYETSRYFGATDTLHAYLELINEGRINIQNIEHVVYERGSGFGRSKYGIYIDHEFYAKLSAKLNCNIDSVDRKEDDYRYQVMFFESYLKLGIDYDIMRAYFNTVCGLGKRRYVAEVRNFMIRSLAELDNSKNLTSLKKRYSIK